MAETTLTLSTSYVYLLNCALSLDIQTSKNDKANPYRDMQMHLCELAGIEGDWIATGNLPPGRDPEFKPVEGYEMTAEDLLNAPDPLVPCYDGGHEFLIRKSTAEDWERFSEFEAAADCADELERINAAKPNDKRDDLFIEKEPKCPFGHSPSATTFGGDALHHSCGCDVLKGEKLV